MERPGSCVRIRVLIRSKGWLDMRRRLATVCLATALMSGPAVAYAQTAELASRESVDIAAGIVTLLAALWLLVVALRLAKVSAGSTYADNIRYVVLGSLCLAGSVLASWSTHFMPDAFTAAQAQLGANLFIVVAIMFLAIYFTRVLRALSRFMKAARTLAATPSPAASDPGPEGTEHDTGEDMADLLSADSDSDSHDAGPADGPADGDAADAGAGGSDG